MKNHEEYENLIKSLGESNFNFLVKEFAKEYYQTQEIHICNGPYDGGLDMVYSKGEKEIKKNIQITVTKTKIEEKLFEDVQKAKDNVSDFDYLSSLDFYISSAITQSKKNKWIRRAEVDYDISLKIIDAKKLSHNSDEFKSISKALGAIYDINESQSIFEISNQDKILFNVIASGENSSKIKRHLIHAVILSNVFQNNGISPSELLIKIKSSISSEITQRTIDDEINYLKSKNNLVGTGSLTLSDTAKERLENIFELNEIQEKQLSSEITKLLIAHNIEGASIVLSRKLIELYIQHFNYEIEEFKSSENSFLKSTNKVFKELCKLLNDNGINEDQQCKKVAKEILEITSSNAFLTKLGASSMYVKLYNSNRLEEFINNSNRSVCLDTQVLLRLLCVLYNPKSNDKSLIAVRNFNSTIKEMNISIDKFTTVDYVEEVAGHLQKALKIYNYLKLPIFSGVGRSRNVFYNYFRELVETNELGEMDFRDFVEKELLGISLPGEFENNFIQIVEKRLQNLFENLGYEIASPPYYDDFINTKKEFEIHLGMTRQNRSFRAIKHDVRTALYMSDQENYFNMEEEIYLDPYLISWDFQFYKLREISKMTYSNYNHWFVYTPQKFVEKLQLSMFKIKPESINETILSLVEEDFNSTSRKNFIDVISSIFNKENVSELKLAQKFANLESEYTDEIESKEEFQKVKQDESPLTIILSIIINHYNNPEIENSMKDFTDLCHNDSLTDDVLVVINSAISAFEKGSLKIDETISEIDKLIENAA